MTDRLRMLASLTGGNCTADAEFSSVGADTRTLQPGQLFFALKGPQRDGHDFVAEAARIGAAAAVVEHPCDSDLPQLQVASAMDAMEALAHHKRRNFFGAVIAVTGSSGKTTVKEMLRSILQQVGPVLASPESYNNRLGVCLTLCSLQPRHRFAVLELGANMPGEIAALADIVRPQTAIITNAGRAHLEGFGTLAGVAQAKGEILDALPEQGTAILPSDESFFLEWRRRAGDRRVIAYGSRELASSRLLCCKPLATGTHIELQALGESLGCDLQLVGKHNATNATAAAAAAVSLEIDAACIATGLSRVAAVDGRLQRLVGLAGSELYDDSYNANPESVRSAIDFLAEQAGRRLLVLGDMAELGGDSAALHREIGRYAKKKGIEELHACGEMAEQAVGAFGKTTGYIYSQIQMLGKAVRGSLKPHTIVLVKGSRRARMNRVVDMLKESG